MTATTKQAAAAFGVTEATVRGWIRFGAVSAVKVAGRWVIDTASLLARKTIAHQITEARQARARRAAATIAVFRYPETRARQMRQARDGQWSFRCDGRETFQHFPTRAEAEQAAATYVPPQPTGKTYHFPVRGEARTTIAAPVPAKKKGCHYCGIPITRHDGECEECGSQTAVAKWIA